ncbi:unnamed protein product [Notodromas monacha]|uniref:Transmembrane protein 115 n=1 Tax=Notodromas monacha TaxID=399045 RepID=A0A7R9G8N9_9CRUS|nr:unnamed protein product [Notodromas monacha]CAG0913414.1 unnamed protein product [Notodromas monacha]
MAVDMRSVNKNLSFILPQLRALWLNTSLFVRVLCVVIVFAYFLSYSENAVAAISITPAYFFPPHFRVWTIFSCFFLEFHLWEVLVDIVTLVLCGKLIEPLWGATEMLTFFGIVNVAVAVASSAFYLVLYSFLFNPELLFDIRIHGLSGYIAAVTVCVKQVIPDQVVMKTPVTKITNRNVPLGLLIIAIILYVLGLVEGTYPVMFGFGLVSSWIYLRFYQHHSNGTKGDMAENFAFATFFPNVIQPPVAVFCRLVFDALVRIKVCGKPVRRYDVAGPSSITITLPGMDTQDAERRRQKALKALNERLGRVESPTTWPSIVDGPGEDARDDTPLLPVHEVRTPSPSEPEIIIVSPKDTENAAPS